MKWFYEIPNSESMYFLILCQDLILKIFIFIFICWWRVNLSSAFKWESNWPPLGRVRGISCLLKKVASASFLYAGSSLSDLTEAKHQFSWQLYSILGNSGCASGEKGDITTSSSLRCENVWDPNAREADLGIGVEPSVYTKDS